MNAMYKRSRINKIAIENEQIGVETIEPLILIMSKGRPNALLELSIVKCRSLTYDLLKELLYGLGNYSNLAKLTFSDMNFDPTPSNNQNEDYGSSAFSLLVQYLAEKSEINEFQSKYQYITHLELSYLGLTPKQLAKIVWSFKDNRTLQFLNLKGNILHSKINGKTQKKKIDSFNKGLCSFIKQNYKSLIHLELSEMGPNLDVFRIVENIALHSKAIQAVHMDLE